jgi:hypothetical protein
MRIPPYRNVVRKYGQVAALGNRSRYFYVRDTLNISDTLPCERK